MKIVNKISAVDKQRCISRGDIVLFEVDGSKELGMLVSNGKHKLCLCLPNDDFNAWNGNEYDYEMTEKEFISKFSASSVSKIINVTVIPSQKVQLTIESK